MDRRQFIRNTVLTATLLPAGSLAGFPVNPPASKRVLKKSIMWDSIGVGQTIPEKFQYAKQAGFDGVQVRSHLDRGEVLKAMDATGLVVSSVCDSPHRDFPLSHPDPEFRKKGVEGLKTALEDAKIYGAGTVLFISGYVTEKVTYKDCLDRSVEEMKKAVPLAEKLGVDIAIENVWNNFLLGPMELAGYIDQFGSPRVKSYFDIGNAVEFGWPEQWIEILGQRIAQVHIKEYSRKIANAQGKWKGFNVKLREGDVNWPAVMKSLDHIGYTGWATIEQGGGDAPEGLQDLCNRLNQILNEE